MGKKIITGIGEILWDLLPEGKKLGGAPLNCIYHTQQLGFKGEIVSSVGIDEKGQEIINRIQEKEINTQYIFQDNTHPTSTVKVNLDEEGNAEYDIVEDVAWDFIPYNEQLKKLANNSTAVCFGSLAQRKKTSRNTIQKVLQNTSRDCIKFFDINLRQKYYNREVIESSLNLTDVLKLNQEELIELKDIFKLSSEENEAIQELLNKFELELIALTKGKHGSKLINQETSSTLTPKETKIVDTIGAGDSFTAALINGLIKDLPITKIHKDANLLASFVCTQNGATPEIPKKILNKIG